MDGTAIPADIDKDLLRALVRMDRSKPYSEIHGSRGPGDPHQHVHFYQDGLPFDAQGHLVIEHPDYEGDSPEAKKRRATAAKKLDKAYRTNARKLAAATQEGGPDMPRGIEDIDADEEDEDDEDGENEVNLDSWIRGANYPWNDVSNAIAARYNKRVASIADAIPFLAEEMSVPKDQVAKRYRKFLD